jgi:hypothetical protein
MVKGYNVVRKSLEIDVGMNIFNTALNYMHIRTLVQSLLHSHFRAGRAIPGSVPLHPIGFGVEDSESVSMLIMMIKRYDRFSFQNLSSP